MLSKSAAIRRFADAQIESIARDDDEAAEGEQDGSPFKRLRNGRPVASRERAASLSGRRGGYAEYSDVDDDMLEEVSLATRRGPPQKV